MSGASGEAFTVPLSLVDAGGDGAVEPACFVAGTRIATVRGPVAVEALRLGALLPTQEGEALPIRWIGHRLVDCTRHPRPDTVWPIRVQAHAFGPGQPGRALFLSPDHAIFAEGVLIPVRHLVNGTTIRQVRRRRVAYFHVELPRHAVLLAEGLAVESYLDTGDRQSFANGGGAEALHPAWGGEGRDVALILEALGAAPLRVTGPEVARVRQALAARAAPGLASGQPLLGRMR